MKKYNCPDCSRTDSCDGCPRTEEYRTNHIPRYFPDSIIWDKNDINCMPKCCKHCSNHPLNGGSGVCNCTLPSYEKDIKQFITCTDNTYYITY